jgi:hypothetical protein
MARSNEPAGLIARAAASNDASPAPGDWLLSVRSTTMKITPSLLAAVLCLSAASLSADCPVGFQPPMHSSLVAYNMVPGDFNNDGYVDLAMISNSSSTPTATITLFLGGAGATFPSSTSTTIAYTQGHMVAVDVNGDGNLDLVVPMQWSDYDPSTNFFRNFPFLQVLQGHGDGTFTVVPYTDQQEVFQNPMRMVLGDFDHDGKVDAATLKDNSELVEMKNLGTFFAQSALYQSSTSGDGKVGTDIVEGDFDGDGERDIAVSEYEVNSQSALTARKVFIFYGVGNGTFVKAANPIDASTIGLAEPHELAAGDFNGDGKDDLAIAMRDPYNNPATYPPLKIALSNGAARTFASPVDYGTVIEPGRIVATDIDGDGKLDLLVAEQRGIQLFHGNGDGTFAAQQTIGASFYQALEVADFDRDGGPDVVATFGTGTIDLYLNHCGRVGLTLTSSANPALQGTPITITGTVVPPPAVPPTGTLTLKRGPAILNSGNLNAGLSVPASMNGLTPGTYPVSFEYSGDVRFAAAVRTMQQVVTPPPFGPPPGLNAISFGGPVQLAWIATADTDHYEIFRSNGAGYIQVGSSPSASFTDATAPSTAALLYEVRAVSATNVASDFGAPDLALTYSFTDGTLQTGVTTIKLAHLTELRSAANAVRALAPSLNPVSWADDIPSVILASHLVELRTAIDDARSALSLSALPHAHQTLTPGSTLIQAIDFAELRTAMR